MDRHESLRNIPRHALTQPGVLFLKLLCMLLKEGAEKGGITIILKSDECTYVDQG